MNERKFKNKNTNRVKLSPLEFNQVLEDLLQIKPVDNAELKSANKPKAKRKPKTE